MIASGSSWSNRADQSSESKVVTLGLQLGGQAAIEYDRAECAEHRRAR